MEFLLIIGSFEAFFIGLLIFVKKDKSISDYLLSSLFIFYAITIGLSFLEILNRTTGYPYPQFISTSTPFILLNGPLIWLYVGSHTTQNFKLKWSHFFHLIPFLGVFTLFYFAIYSLPIAERIAMDSQATFKQLIAYPIIISLIALSTIIYYTWSLLMILKFNKNIKSFFAKIDKIDLKWLKIIIIFSLVCHISISGLYIIDLLIGWMPYSFMQIIGFMIASIYIIGFGFFGFKQGNLFTTTPINLNLEAASEKPIINTPISNEDELFVHQLLEFVKQKQSYINPELTLAKLSEELNVNSEYLSSILNGRLNMNFFDFINHYRVEAFKVACKNPENRNLTLISIAYDCGFNSKATFNRVFKKITNLTPSEYYRTGSRN
jgi:AraC-like DNA-binding protein